MAVNRIGDQNSRVVEDQTTDVATDSDGTTSNSQRKDMDTLRQVDQRQNPSDSDATPSQSDEYQIQTRHQRRNAILSRNPTAASTTPQSSTHVSGTLNRRRKAIPLKEGVPKKRRTHRRRLPINSNQTSRPSVRFPNLKPQTSSDSTSQDTSSYLNEPNTEKPKRGAGRPRKAQINARADSGLTSVESRDALATSAIATNPSELEPSSLDDPINRALNLKLLQRPGHYLKLEEPGVVVAVDLGQSSTRVSIVLVEQHPCLNEPGALGRAEITYRYEHSNSMNRIPVSISLPRDWDGSEEDPRIKVGFEAKSAEAASPQDTILFSDLKVLTLQALSEDFFRSLLEEFHAKVKKLSTPINLDALLKLYIVRIIRMATEQASTASGAGTEVDERWKKIFQITASGIFLTKKDEASFRKVWYDAGKILNVSEVDILVVPEAQAAANGYLAESRDDSQLHPEVHYLLVDLGHLTSTCSDFSPDKDPIHGRNTFTQMDAKPSILGPFGDIFEMRRRIRERLIDNNNEGVIKEALDDWEAKLELHCWLHDLEKPAAAAVLGVGTTTIMVEVSIESYMKRIKLFEDMCKLHDAQGIICLGGVAAEPHFQKLCKETFGERIRFSTLPARSRSMVLTGLVESVRSIHPATVQVATEDLMMPEWDEIDGDEIDGDDPVRPRNVIIKKGERLVPGSVYQIDVKWRSDSAEKPITGISLHLGRSAEDKLVDQTVCPSAIWENWADKPECVLFCRIERTDAELIITWVAAEENEVDMDDAILRVLKCRGREEPGRLSWYRVIKVSY